MTNSERKLERWWNLRPIFTVGLGLLVSIWAGPSRAELVVGNDFNWSTAISAEVLQQWYNSQGLWDTTGWWNAAHCVEAIENAIVASNGHEHLEVLNHTFELNSTNRFLNEYYDDEGWWALAWIRAYDLTGEERYLAMAKTIFADLVTGWDDHCGGGIWWKKDRRYKNAVANELFLIVAIKLHQRTPDDAGPDSYLNQAQREWLWFKQTGIINAQNLINDGLNQRCENNRRTVWTYNQGVILGGLTELYKATGDLSYLNEARTLADAATVRLSTNGILRESCEPDRCGGADVPQFKGIFVRYLADLYDVTRRPEYFHLLLNSARSTWANNRDAAGRFGLRWTGPIDSVDAARQSSAMMPISVLAEPMTENLLFATGSGNPVFSHDVGEASGTQAWRCDPAMTTEAGFMQRGPYLASLPIGRHTIQFHLAVNALSNLAINLARLDVREGNGEKILATRELAWNSFTSANQPQAFDLVFTNTTPGNPLEFRVYWNHATGAPALTITDVTIGGARSWTAANLDHEVGQLDGLNTWCADPVRNQKSGYLVKGPGVSALPAGEQRAVFELKVDNFNWDKAPVATLSVVDVQDGTVVAERVVRRNDFRNILYHAFPLDFRAAAGRRYDFRTFWQPAPHAPRLTQRSVIVRPAGP